jgi:hypothetical protein
MSQKVKAGFALGAAANGKLGELEHSPLDIGNTTSNNRPVDNPVHTKRKGTKMNDTTVVTASKAFCKKAEFIPGTGDFSFAFGNGEIVSGNLSEFSEEIVEHLAIHGVYQKGGDSYAGVKGDYAEGISNLREVLDNLRNNSWSSEREGGVRIADLAAAIARIKGVTLEAATAAVTAASDEDRKTWRAHAEVKKTIADIAAERAKAALDAATAAAPMPELNIKFA